MDYILIAAGVAVIAAGVLCVTSYNRLMAMDSRCDKASADIDVQLKHRHSLIPNLLELLKGYMGHELHTLEAIGKARQHAITAPTVEARQQAEAILGKSLNRIVLTAEQLPSLRANEHFRALRNELSDAENKIASARRFLNLAVDEFNSSLKQFPNNFLSGTTRLSARNFFDLGYDRPMIEEGPEIKF
jgi:LemA protein